MKHNCFCGQLSQDAALLDRTLRVSESFDLIARNAQVGGRNARFYWIDGFVKDEVMEKILEYLFTLSPEELSALPGPGALADRCVPYTESAVVTDPRETAI